MRSIVITGVSTGIGRGAAASFARAGYQVFGSVRREEDAMRLRGELGERFVPLAFDVTDREAVLGAAEEVGEAVGAGGLAGLVNNAGTAVAGPLALQPLDDVRAQFEANVLGLVSVTQAFLPLLGMDRSRSGAPGRIVNMSSVGGKVASPFIGAYAGTKHAVEGLSDALRRELMPYGIDVIVVRPGAVKTEIWAKGATSKGLYAGTDYQEPLERFEAYANRLAGGGYSPEEFGRLVLRAFEAKRPRTRYAIVRGRFANWVLPTLLPDRWLDRIIGRTVGLA
jgi:NAD(P)-dependent dehydrogenase (short-subunit alcohol dehydrogenase family)